MVSGDTSLRRNCYSTVIPVGSSSDFRYRKLKTTQHEQETDPLTKTMHYPREFQLSDTTSPASSPFNQFYDALLKHETENHDNGRDDEHDDAFRDTSIDETVSCIG